MIMHYYWSFTTLVSISFSASVVILSLLRTETVCAFVFPGEKNNHKTHHGQRRPHGPPRHHHVQEQLQLQLQLQQHTPQNYSRSTLLQLISHGIDYSFLRGESDVVLSKEDILDEYQLGYITDLVNRRSDARKNGDYQLADLIRDELNSLRSSALPNRDLRYVCDSNSSKRPKNSMETCIIPKGYIVEIKDIPRIEGGGSTWSLQLERKESIDWVNNAESGAEKEHKGKNTSIHKGLKNDSYNLDNNRSVLKIAHSALGLASWSSENRIPVNQTELNTLVLQAKTRLLQTGSRELRGRKAADAAFWFSMAGVKDDLVETNLRTQAGDRMDTENFSLFDALTFICIDELRRFGKRSSCRATDIMHMVERITASGIQSEMSAMLQREAAECLLTKDLVSSGLHDKGIIEDLQNNRFRLHSERPLLWIWRFSTRQRKQQAFLKSASKHWESNNKVDIIPNESSISKMEGEGRAFNLNWKKIFKDPTKPLVLDIGCGMGISLLGLASLSEEVEEIKDKSLLDIDWKGCNFLGADLSQLAINYASSITHRWELEGKAHFEVISAEEVIDQVMQTYPGALQLVLIQFPTPFSFQEYGKGDSDEEKGKGALQSVAKQGNMQLPRSAISGFMVTRQLLDMVHKTLEVSTGKLILQSNCEDVAVFMKNVATDEVGFQAIDVPSRVKVINSYNGMTMRTEKWIAQGGERAEGAFWSARQILPSIGSTETEIACEMNGTPIHRCILKVN